MLLFFLNRYSFARLCFWLTKRKQLTIETFVKHIFLENIFGTYTLNPYRGVWSRFGGDSPDKAWYVLLWTVWKFFWSEASLFRLAGEFIASELLGRDLELGNSLGHVKRLWHRSWSTIFWKYLAIWQRVRSSIRCLIPGCRVRRTLSWSYASRHYGYVVRLINC